MLLVKVKNPTIEFTVPNAWSEVTLKQFLALHDRMRTNEQGQQYYLLRDALECFASDVDALHQLGAYEEQQMRQRLKYLDNRPDFRQLSPPERIAGVKPPLELGNCSLKQKWAIDNLMLEWEEEGKTVDFISLAVPLLSVYLYPLLTGKAFTSEDQIEEVTAIIEALPVTEALPLAAFFLTRWQTSTGSGRAIYQERFPSPSPSEWRTRLRQSWRHIRSIAWFGASPKTGV